MPFVDTPSLITELDAVNICLAAKGVERTTSLLSPDVDVSNALFALEQADLEVQGAGYSFNEMLSVTLVPTGDQTIVLPFQTMSAPLAYYDTSGQWLAADLRGGKLYDLANNTFLWTQNVVCDVRTRVAFTDLPQQARNYVAKLAASRFQGKTASSATAFRITQEEVRSALVSLEQYDDEARARNPIRNNREDRERMYGPVRRRNDF